MSDKSSSRTVRIAVMSDIHASNDKADSWLCIDGADTDLQSPVRSLLSFLEAHNTKVDFLVCCGDIGNRAHPATVSHGWSQVHKIAEKLEARVIATAGNHDVDSRFDYSSFDAKGHLQSLDPAFPLDDEVLNDRFWSRNFAIVQNADIRFVVLNSAAYHGYEPTSGEPEYEHGRIAEKTAETMMRELDVAEKAAPINILLCHHHPHKHGDLVAEPDYSAMKNGHRLIDLLDAQTSTEWLILHGHKHQPRLCYAAGSSNPPVVFGVGSFSAKLHPEVSQVAKNQFYILSFNIDEQHSQNMDLAGTFEAFDWVTSIGWQPAGESSGLPPFGGFGYKLSRIDDAEAVVQTIRDSGKRYLMWSEIIACNPKFKYLIPADFAALRSTLRKDFNVRVMVDPKSNDLQLSIEEDG